MFPEDWRQHAWHCLLNMTDPFTAPARWSYGLTPVSMENIRTTFSSMEVDERQIMFVELLRVLALLLGDLSRAIAEGTGSDELEAANRRAEEEEERSGSRDGEDSALVQTGRPSPLHPRKAARLEAASERRVVDPRTLLGGPMDQLSCTLMEAMERMTADETMRCGQALLILLLNHYGVPPRDFEEIPSQAAGLAYAMVTCGADMDQRARDPH